jgi:hypothetical protein
VALNQQANIYCSIERVIRIVNKVQIFVHNRIILAVKRVEFVSDRMLLV